MIKGDTIKLNNHTPKLMDKLLSIGYFRSGKNMFHSPVTFIEGVPNTTIRTRLPLENHAFGKRTRKLFRKNNELFSHRFESLDIDEDLLDLYDEYKNYCFKGDLNGELYDWLEGSLENEIFETQVCKVFFEDKLIAASFVDIGSNSIASIMGIYSPQFSKYSLGLYSMLVEVEYAKTLGKDFYYPGYILSATPRFEYKKKVGKLEYKGFDTNEWKALDEITEESYFVEKSIVKLEEVKALLEEFMIESEIFSYPLFTWNTYPLNASLLEQYFFLKIKLDLFDTLQIIVVYDMMKRGYVVHLSNSIGEDSPTWQEFKNFYPEDGNWLDTILIQSSSKLENDINSIPVIVISILKTIKDKIKIESR